MDPYLLALARAAEDGETCPMVRLVLESGTLVVGQPTTSRAFVDATFEAMRHEAAAQRSRKQRKGDSDAAIALATDALRPINVSVDAGTTDYLTLRDVQAFWGGGADGVNARVIRVALAGVMMWWITGARTFKGQAGSGAGIGVGVGGIFPID